MAAFAESVASQTHRSFLGRVPPSAAETSYCIRRPPGREQPVPGSPLGPHPRLPAPPTGCENPFAITSPSSPLNSDILGALQRTELPSQCPTRRADLTESPVCDLKAPSSQVALSEPRKDDRSEGRRAHIVIRRGAGEFSAPPHPRFNYFYFLSPSPANYAMNAGKCQGGNTIQSTPKIKRRV